MKATAWRALGGLAGGIGGIGLGLGITKGFGANFGLGLLALAGLIVVCVVLYLVARTQSTAGSRAGELMPGVLLGVNTGVNGVLIAAIVGPIVAIALCVLPALAVIEPVSRSDIYQAPLGWGNFLLPMSWPIVGLGLLILIFSGILALVNLAIHSTFLDIEKLKLQAKTGTTFLVGGLGGNANLNPDSTGYNMGSFAFIRNGKPSEYLYEHESGHTLNLAIWGPIVHLIGALDENVFGGHANAYTELFAESNVPPVSREGPIFPMWGDPTAAPATASTPLTTPA
ncbi:MAG TPA: hypothetical protein VFV49_04030 [Thermoanaerobaculia bacterium]|nr:hypothetical protein [Thermoanaerobaculia bacterium]